MKYKLILTDFKMPITDGIEATKQIRALLSNTYKISLEDQPKILGITGHVLDTYVSQGMAVGMNEVLSKPLYMNELKRILKQYYYDNNQ